MEDSFKGFLSAGLVIMLFVVCIVNFIYLFPQEQGVTFIDPQGQISYNLLGNQTVTDSVTSNLANFTNQTETGFNNWDITVGFMGSPSIKQSSQTSATSYIGIIFNFITLVATNIFGLGSPVLIVLGIITGFVGLWVIFLVIKLVRTGN